MPGSTKCGQNHQLRILTTQYTELDCMVSYVNTDTESFKILKKPLKNNTKHKEEHLLLVMQSKISVQQISNEDIYRQAVDALPSSLTMHYKTWINTGIKMYVAGVPES